ncbi:MAG: hypothetical protein M1817_001634 [Caeruleum heppii]|nr:MAG: hypothetical protein M1817_001634 [Caeruleum heppii]
MAEGLTTSFLGAIQASVSIILVISSGVLASQFQILKDASARDISKLCVRLFLPALLVSNVGSELHLETLGRYVPILVWSLFYNLLSMGIGIAATKFLKLPSWTTPAIAFNNTTSLPLLLIQSLDATGILKTLLMNESDSTKDAIARAKSYFLVCSIVGNCLTFALGPKLLDGEEAPDEKEDSPEEDDEANGDVESGNRPSQEDQTNASNGEDGQEPTEDTSLLPDRFIEEGGQAQAHVQKKSRKYWDRLPIPAQRILDFLYAFFNAPLIGALLGAFIGLIPPLHQAFFAATEEGGIFKAWLTSAIENLGGLFAALQLVVVGSKLSVSLRAMKKGEESGQVPWAAMGLVFFVRFVFWPAVSIPTIYLLATRTTLLGTDPMLWFVMMLLATGPSAIKLTALADVNGSNDVEKMSIAKFLTISYAISPIIAFPVVGALKASQAAME